jgi:hypothetical protein
MMHCLPIPFLVVWNLRGNTFRDKSSVLTRASVGLAGVRSRTRSFSLFRAR